MVKCGYVVLRQALVGFTAERGIISQHPGPSPRAVDFARRDPIRLTRASESLHGRIRDYVGRRVLPSLGIGVCPFTVEPPPDLGTRSSLWLVRIEGRQPLLLRSHAHPRQASASVAAMRHMEALSLPAPRVVYHHIPIAAWLIPGRGPRCTTVETWIDGIAHARLSDPAAIGPATLKVAQLLARLHSVTRRQWGRPDRPGSGSFSRRAVALARRMLRDLVKTGWLDEESRSRVESELAASRERIDAIRSFSLVHNDLNRHNVVVGADGSLALVDLHRIAYEPFPEEVLNAAYHFTRKDADLGAQFEETYFEHAGEPSRRLFYETRGFFEPLHFLKKMHRRARLLGPRHSAPDDQKMTRYLRGMETT